MPLMDPLAPPVVVVVVTRDPGPWFEETLDALAAQDYPDLSVLVVDAASATDPTARVAARLPAAFVRRLPSNGGFAASANEALSAVEGASHLVLSHDDVAPAPDAVRCMVEEAYRSNAGVVAPKLVEWSHPDRLLQVGMAADKGGAFSSRVEPGELDQEQHDAVRDVFVAQGGFVLVRADLFKTLGGFDPSMFMFGEDLDLSWRAHIAGARVLVVPSARVRHLEATTTRRRELPVPPADLPEAGAEAAGPDEHGEAADGKAPQQGSEQERPARRRFHRRGAPGPGPAAAATGLRRRNELRAVLKNYSRWHLVRVLPQLAFVDLAEVVYSLLAGHGRHAAAVVGAWRANLRSFSALRSARREVESYRRVPDQQIRRLQSHGSARLSSFVRHQLSTGRGARRLVQERKAGEGGTAGGRRSLLQEPGFRMRVGFWVAAALVLVYGARQLIGPAFPLVGQLAPVPSSGSLLHQYLAGWRTAGLGSQGSPPAAFGVLGLGGIVTLGSTGLLQKVLVLGALPVGAVGAFRMARPLPSLPRLLAALVYLAVPLGYNEISQGHLQALLMLAAAPWLLGRLLRAGGLAPFADRSPGALDQEALDGPGEDPSWAGVARQCVPFGILAGLLSSLVPAGLVVIPLTAASLAAVTALTGQPRAGSRVLAVGFGGTLAAFLLTLPWSFSLLGSGSQLGAVTGLASSPSNALGLGAVLRFQTGGLGGAPVGWVFLAAAGLPLLIGRGWRLTWAVRLWGVAAVAWAAAWMAGRGWLGSSVPSPDVLLAPAAAATALAIALGLVAFAMDLPRYRFGWRQAASLAAGLFVVLGCLPVLASAVGGRWNLPSQGFDQAFSYLPSGSSSGGYRVLWLGDPQVLPLQGWSLGGGVSYGTSDSGLPVATDLVPDPKPGPAAQLGGAVEAAWSGRTADLGHLLASLSVRYLIVPSSLAPSLGGSQQSLSAPPPPSLVSALLDQDDLKQLSTGNGVLVLQNMAWIPERAVLATSATGATRQGLSTTTDLSSARPVLPGPAGSLSFSGRLPPGRLLVSVPRQASWQLAVGGAPASGGEAAFGWSSSYAVPRSGYATLSLSPSSWHYLAIVLEVLLWLAAIAGAVLGWRRRSRSVSPAPTAPDDLAVPEQPAGVAGGRT